MIETSQIELEKYIKQIKSYEAQSEIIELTKKEEEDLKKNRPRMKLVLWSGIAGLEYHIKKSSESDMEILNKLKPGVELKLARDKDNQYDRWAVAIYTIEGKMLGFVTRYKNETIARLMDAGYSFRAFVENEKQTNYIVPNKQRALTENYNIPYSVWME